MIQIKQESVGDDQLGLEVNQDAFSKFTKKPDPSEDLLDKTSLMPLDIIKLEQDHLLDAPHHQLFTEASILKDLYITKKEKIIYT